MKKQKKAKKTKIALKTETVRALATDQMSQVGGGLYTSPSLTTGRCQCEATTQAQ